MTYQAAWHPYFFVDKLTALLHNLLDFGTHGNGVPVTDAKHVAGFADVGRAEADQISWFDEHIAATEFVAGLALYG